MISSEILLRCCHEQTRISGKLINLIPRMSSGSIGDEAHVINTAGIGHHRRLHVTPARYSTDARLGTWCREEIGIWGLLCNCQ